LLLHRHHHLVLLLPAGCMCGLCGSPALIAFTGKRQFLELLNIDPSGQLRRGKARVASAAVQLGKQPADMLPAGWPLPVDRTEVWVLTSTSGAAPMSNADRERPYKHLAERLAGITWPRSDIVLTCRS
jgi:TDG/mug DNA glycosylase family protein